MYHNNGDGTFTDVSDSHARRVGREGHSFIGAFTDYDNDGDPRHIENQRLFRSKAPTPFQPLSGTMVVLTV